MNIDQVRHRYNNDLLFNTLVENIYHIMYEMKFIHEELRNVVFWLRFKIEEQRIPLSFKSEWYKENVDGKY